MDKFTANGLWGDNIIFMDDISQRVYTETEYRVSGHSPKIPKNGDWFLVKMRSGKVAIFIFHNVERMSDPRDMFFANVMFSHYDVGGENFQRENAISTICRYSHCTVAFTQPELDVLSEFIATYFEGNL